MANAEKLENVVKKISTEFDEDRKKYPYEAEDVEPEVEDVDEDIEEVEDEQEEEELEDVQPQKTAKKTSKEQQKIIALKRENQRLAEENRKLAVIQAQEVKASTDRKADLKKQYVADGYDEDVASNMADRDERLYLQDQRLSAIEFREENFDVLSQYPQSKKDMTTIMNAVRATNMTVEQVCRGLYGSEPMGYNERARAAAEGTLPRRSQDDYVSATETNGSRRRQQALTPYDREQKEKLEDLTGLKISNERYLQHKAKYDL